MGLPRASGKRRWSGEDDDDDEGRSPPKVLCTSPPYALCAEDVLPHPSPTPTHRLSESAMTETLDECEMTQISSDNEDNVVSDCEDALPQYNEREEDENFIDDEEDKDSGFIDGNSIDHSSDDDCDAKGDTSFTSSSSSSQSQHHPPETLSLPKEEPLPETDFQISLAKVLSSSSQLSTAVSTSVTTCITVSSSSSSSIATLESSSSSKVEEVKGDECLLEVTSNPTSTVVRTTYQSSVPLSSYDLLTYQSADNSSDLYQSRPCTPSWSCTFYDGSQPTTTNKYMEISPNRALSGQSIQCDENGKSYLELGSASPYSSNYSSDCGNFPAGASSSTYNSTSYSQSFTGSSSSTSTSTYSPPQNSSGYFNNRAPYAPSSQYNYGSDGYNGTYDEGVGSYSYINGGYNPHSPGRGPGVPNRIQSQRCTSPSCDPTRMSPRPTCYPQQRLAVLNMSMFKLNRFSRFPEPSLHRSVLICNTLRHIEREMETEGLNMATILAHSHSYGANAHGPGGPPPIEAHCQDTLPSMPSTNTSGEGPLPPIHSPLIGSPLHPATPPPSTPLYSSEASSLYNHVSSYPNDSRDSPIPFEPLRENSPLRPFSPPPPGERHSLLTSSETLSQEEDTDSVSPHRLCEDRAEGGINWCSVLSLSSQTDLDSMNNNECNEWNNEPESSTTLTTLTSRGLPPPSGSLVSLAYSSESEESMDDTSSSSPNWKLPSLSADDVLKSFPEPSRRQEEDLDSIIKVLVGS